MIRPSSTSLADLSSRTHEKPVKHRVVEPFPIKQYTETATQTSQVCQTSLSNERNSLARRIAEKDIGVQISPTIENVRSRATTDPLLFGSVTTMNGQQI